MKIKHCNKCGLDKSITKFCKNKNEKGGLNYTCKECTAKLMKVYWSKKVNKDKAKERHSKDRKEIKDKVFSHYGKECSCCGEPNLSMLAIDHTNNNGNIHRRKLGITTGEGFYRWLVKNNFPKEFQTLCYNCNIGKHRNNGICPHKL